MPDISIPQSVQDYFTRKGIRTAVDLLLEQDDEYLPENLDWDELRSFHKSVLAAYTIRTDYAILLLDAWDAIWEPALSACGLRDIRDVLPIDDNSEDAKPSPLGLWDDGLFRAHRHPGNRNAFIWTSVSYDGPKTGFRLGVSCWNKRDKTLLEEDTELGELWTLRDEDDFDGWFSTREEAFPLAAGSNLFDQTEIQKTAEAALRVILDT